MKEGSASSSSSSLALTTASIASAVGLGVALRYWQTRRTISTTKPPPPKAPAGMLDTIAAISGPDAPWFLLRMARTMQEKGHKIFQVSLPLPKPVYCIASADLQRQVLSDKQADKPRAVYGTFESGAYPAGIFTRATHDPQWKVSRKSAAPAFSKSEIQRMNAVCSKHVEHWIEERLESFIGNNQAFDPSREMTFLTFSTIMEAAFEYVCTRPEFEAYTHNVDTWLTEFGFRQLANPLRRYFGWFLSDYRHARKAEDDNYEFLKKVVHTYQNSTEKSPNKTILKLLLQTDMSELQLLAEIGTFIAGGFDTTGYSLSTTLVLLAQHPDVAAQVRVAQAQVPDGGISEYLRCVIKESRRYLTVAAMGASRQYMTKVPLGDYEIPAGATLLLPQMPPHRDAKVYAPDPDVFRPERWLEKNAPTVEMQESLMTFSVGARNCIGQALAVAELDSVLSRLLTSYQFTVEEEGYLHYFFTLKYRGTRLRATKLE